MMDTTRLQLPFHRCLSIASLTVYIPDVRRLVAFMLSLVLVQLVLVESGYACRMSEDTSTPASSMAAMQMPERATDTPSAPAQHDEQGTPCSFPWAPGGCQSMAPCAPSALIVVVADFAADAPEPGTPALLVPLAPPTRTTLPELPPPRA